MSGFEVVGAVAAAGQFLEQGYKVAGFIRAVVSQVADGPEQITAWLEELETLNGIAEQIRSTAKLHSDETERILVRCEGLARRLEAQLRSLSFSPEERTLRKTWRAICTLDQEDGIMKIMQSLVREKQSLNSLLLLGVASMTGSGLSSVESKLDAMALNSAAAGSDEDQCLAALFLTDPVADRAGLVTRKGQIVQGTCDWVIETDEFIRWRQDDGSLLWITGRPGLGKTMLSIFLATHLEESATPLSERGLELTAYFFCDNRDNRRNHPTAIIRGLLTLLLQRAPDLITYILPSYKVQGSGLFEPSSFESLWSIFIDVVNHSGIRRVSCVVDGLDECESVEDLETFLTKIKSVPQTAPRVSVIIVSRDYPKCLPVALGRIPRIRLDPDHKDEVRSGLEAYIVKSVEELQSEMTNQFSDALVERIKNTLRERSNGTFIWVSFVVKELRNKEATEVERCLEELPRGLDNMYARMLNQVENSRRGIVRAILRWCTFAQRPLELWELAAALETETPAPGPLHAIDAARSYVAYCGGFVTLRDTDVLGLVHQSAKDFLIKMPIPQAKNPITWLAPLDPKQEHSVLASKCLGQLSRTYKMGLNVFSQLQLKKSGILFYASRFWHEHLRNVGDPAEQDRVIQQHDEFFRRDSPAREAWMRWGLITSDYTDENFSNFSKEGNLLEIACFLGLDFMLPSLIPRRKLLDRGLLRRSQRAKDLESPLALAIAKGHIQVAKYLVERGAEVNGRETKTRSGDGGDRAPLTLACEYAPLEMVRFLLRSGAKVNDPHYVQPPLQRAVKRCKLELIELLIEHGADVKATDDDGYSVLHSLIRDADTKHVDINARDYRERTPLHRIAGRGQRDCVKVLLRHVGVTVDARDVEGKTPLHLASYKGYYETAKLLLQDGKADINSRNIDQQTALHSLMRGIANSGLDKYKVKFWFSNWRKTLYTLLEAGADVSLEDSVGRKPGDLIANFEGHGGFPERRSDLSRLEEEGLGPELSRWRNEDRYSGY
ncbi:ankyrin [Colletotrichum falcatum]|nr:ankyrin [Colletotrichum falcatum]